MSYKTKKNLSVVMRRVVVRKDEKYLVRTIHETPTPRAEGVAMARTRILPTTE